MTNFLVKSMSPSSMELILNVSHERDEYFGTNQKWNILTDFGHFLDFALEFKYLARGHIGLVSNEFLVILAWYHGSEVLFRSYFSQFIKFLKTPGTIIFVKIKNIYLIIIKKNMAKLLVLVPLRNNHWNIQKEIISN